MERNDALETVELGLISTGTHGDEGRPIEGAGLFPVSGISD
ncbi:hypothetical protein [Sphingopyxis terrae]|nr:hypothetical protein [Sphingopyxis terrae]